jgi:hypothetical protein
MIPPHHLIAVGDEEAEQLVCLLAVALQEGLEEEEDVFLAVAGRVRELWGVEGRGCHCGGFLHLGSAVCVW